MKIVVIGAGFGGLAAAIRLRAQGHEVTIVEQRDKPGGRAYVYEQNGFTFDGGPTIITAPWLIRDLFTLCGRDHADYVRLVPVDPYYNIRFTDGSVFRYDGNREHVRDEVRRFNPDDVDGYERFYRDSAGIFETGFGLIDKPFLHLTDMAKVLPDLVRLRADRSVASYVSRYIKDERLRQVFSFHPLLVGGNPFATTSIYTLIHRLEQEWGVWFAMGGTGALVRALVSLFEDIGGTLRLSTPVAEIVVNDRRVATGVRLTTGEVLAADAVVSNADVAWTYLNLVPKQARRVNTDRRIKKMRYSMSLFVIYFGTNRRYDDIAHHEILMGPRYEGLLDDIFRTKRLAEDFSLYLHRPTATDPSLAPPGCDAWYVLSPSRTSAATRTGRPRRRGTVTRSWGTSSDTTSPTSRSTSSPSTASTRCTSRVRCRATSAPRSRWNRFSRRAPGCARTTGARMSRTSTSPVPARTRAPGSPACSARGRSSPISSARTRIRSGTARPARPARAGRRSSHP